MTHLITFIPMAWPSSNEVPVANYYTECDVTSLQAQFAAMPTTTIPEAFWERAINNEIDTYEVEIWRMGDVSIKNGLYREMYVKEVHELPHFNAKKVHER